jgi:integrase
MQSPALEIFPDLKSSPAQANFADATPRAIGRKVGPVVTRRFQEGSFQIRKATGSMFSVFYQDVQQPDGTTTTRRVRHLIGNLKSMSERAARREHGRIMHEINRKRGSVAPAIKGQSFRDTVTAWTSAVAPHLSPSTVRQRESYLRQHVLPRFGDSAPHMMDVSVMQQFATELRKTLSRKTTINVLSAVFVILEYAGRCGVHVAKVSFSDLELGTDTTEPQAAYFTREQATRIIEAAKEPYKTLFATAWATGLRAGEILALKTIDVDFERQTIRVERSADDNTREIRQPKTKKSTATLPLPSALAGVLRNYLKNHWRPNPIGLLFANPKGTHPRWRDNVVKYGLKPVLAALNMPSHNTGLHAFRHGLATDLANAGVPLPVLQKQMRHADVRTTLSVYAHVIQGTQRDAMEAAAIGTRVPNAAQAGA